MPTHQQRQQAPISVIIPAYNCEAYIAEAIESALWQETPPLEIIVIDDGSTDRTPDIVQRYGEPVYYHRLKGSRNGAAVARNTAISVSRGEYLAFLDADDVWLPGKLASQLQALDQNPDVDLCATDFAIWRPTQDGTWPPLENFVESSTNKYPGDAINTEKSGWLYTQLLLDTQVWTSTVLVRRALINRVGFFREDLRLGQDYDYWLRASRETQIITLDTVYALYRKHPDSATAEWATTNYELVALRGALKRWGRTGPDGQQISLYTICVRIGTLHFNMAYNQLWSSTPSRAIMPAFKAAFYRPKFFRAWAYIALALFFTLRQHSKILSRR